jgi:hypothetical protein
MIRIQFILFCVAFTYACSSNSSGVRNETDSVSDALHAVLKDSIHNSIRILANRKINDSDTTLTTGTPAITSLPFGPHIAKPSDLCTESFTFYRKLVGENLDKSRPEYTETYLLPATREMHYRILDPAYETGICNNDVSVNDLFKVNKYKYRLPDRGGNEIYYMTNKAKTSRDFSKEFEIYCENILPDFYGYLIVRNKKTNVAFVLSVYQETYRDSYTARQFYIEKDYTIRVCNIQYAEGPDGADKFTGPAYEVMISNDGDFSVKKISE